MKTNTAVWLLYLSIILYAAGGNVTPLEAQADSVIAIWDLEDLTPVPSDAADMGDMLSAKIIEAFEASGNYRVVERQRLMLVLEELDLGTSKLVSEATKLEIGRLVGARMMVFGSYIILNDTMRMDLRKVEVETGRVLKAVSKTSSETDIVKWLKITREAAKELL